MLAFSLKSQELSYSYFDVENGLPSSNVYDVAEDLTGNIWIATEKGVAKYDGRKFENYTENNGLAENSIIRILVKDELVYLIGYQGSLSVIEKNAVRVVYRDLFSEEKLPENISNLMLIKDHLYFNNDSGDLVSIDLNTREKLLYEFDYDNLNARFLSHKNNYIYTNNKKFQGYNNSVSNDLYLNNDSIKNIIGHCQYQFNMSSKQQLLSYGSLLLVKSAIHPPKIIKSEKPIVSFFEDKQRNILLCFENEGLQIFDQVNGGEEFRHYFRSKTITKIIQDREAGFWMVVRNEGVYYLPDLNIELYRELNSPVMTLANFEDNLCYLNYSNEIYLLKFKGNKLIQNYQIPFSYYQPYQLEDVAFKDGNRIWLLISSFKNIRTESSRGNLKAFLLDFQMFDHKYQSTIIDSQVFKGSYKLALNPIDHYKEKNFKLSFDKNNKPLLSDLQALIVKEGDKYVYKGQSDKLLGERITVIESSPYNLWAGYRDMGLRLIDQSLNIKTYSVENGLSNNMVKSILLLNDSVALIGTLSGLNILRHNKGELTQKIVYYNEKDGLKSSEINDLIEVDNKIWVATRKGICSIYKKHLKSKTKAPSIGLESIQINRRDTSRLDQYKLRHNQNNITLFLTGISQKYPDMVVFRYRLQDGEPWKTTKNRVISLFNLFPGTYKVSAQASVNESEWSDSISFGIVIRKPFYQTTGFTLLLIFIIAVIGFLVSYLIIRNQKRKYTIEKKLIQSEQKALRAQMNPHFIFNSLNSIRRYALDNNTKLVDVYLSDFADLIRKILENSRQNRIRLNEEIEFLGLYLRIEKLRFKSKFFYKINTDLKENPINFLIPPMLIQPFVENAIWHGLMPKNDDGILEINFVQKEEDVIVCSIEDNGIGRAESARINEKRVGHKSIGLKNIEERIELISKVGVPKIKFEIKDLIDEYGNAKGTYVELEFKYY